MASELASAYITLIPSLKGASKTIASQLGDIDMSKPGKAMGKNLADAMSKGLDASGLKKYQKAVQEAEKGVSDAMERSADAIKKVEIAQKQLSEARAKYGDDSSQAAQAELNLTKAQRESATAAQRVTTANQKLEQAQRQLAEASEQAAQAATRQQSALARLATSATKAGAAMQGAGKSLQKVGSGLDSLGSTLTSHVTAPIAAAATGIGAFALKTASAAETSEMAFTTMLGSADKAKQMVSTLADFAAKTPFELSGLTTATQQLLAYGFTAEDVIPMLTAVGDATAALGTGQVGIEAVTRALGQMQTKGKVSAEEMLQLTEQGIPAWKYLAEAIGTDTAGAMEQVSKGAVKASDGIKAITEGMERDFGGMMENQAKTLEGLMSNLSDTITQPFMELKDSDAYGALTDALEDIIDAAGPFVESLLPAMEDGLGVVADVLETAADGMEAFADMSDDGREQIVQLVAAAAAAGPALSVLGKGIDAAGSLMEGAGKGLTSFGDILGKIGDNVMPKVIGAFGEFGPSLASIGSAIPSISGPVGILAGAIGVTLVSAIGLFVAEAAEANAHMELMSDVTMDAGDIMAEASGDASSLGDAIGGIQADVDGTLKSMQSLNKSVSETLQSVEEDGMRLDQYVATIEELGNQSGLSATEQYRLKQAVDGYNSVVGTQYSVIDAANGKIADQNGVIQTNTEELNKNAEAWKNRAKAEAYQSVAAEYMEEETKAAYELSVANGELTDAYERRDKAADIINGKVEASAEEVEKARGEWDKLNRQIPDLEQNVRDLGGAYDAANQNAEDFTAMGALQESLYDTLGDSTDAFIQSLVQSGVSMSDFASLSDEQIQQLAQSWDGSTQSIIDGLNNMGQSALVNGAQINDVLSGFSEGEIANALTAAGIDLDEFSIAMANAGISAQQLNAIGSENFSALAASAGGNIDQLIGMLSIYNSAPIYDKNGNITADKTQLVDALGNIYEWNGTQLLTKSGQVVMTVQELYDAQGEVVQWNDSGQLVDKNGQVLVDDTQLQDANGNILTWNNNQLTDQQGNVYIEQQELYDALGNCAEFNGTTLTPIQGEIYCDYSELTAALGELSKLPKSYTSTVYINTVRTTTNRTVNDGASGQSVQRVAPMSYAAPMAASAGISTLALDGPTPVYAAGDDGVAHPVASLAAPGISALSVPSGFSANLSTSADALKEIGRAIDAVDSSKLNKVAKGLESVADGADDMDGADEPVAKLGEVMEQAGEDAQHGFSGPVMQAEQQVEESTQQMSEQVVLQVRKVADGIDQAKIDEQIDAINDALTEDGGLNDAFKKTGKTVQQFAQDLVSFGMTADDVKGKVTSFASSVSNGFSAISRWSSDVSLYDYTNNLKNNIQQAKWYAQDMEKVFTKLGDYAGADAFRKEVMEGGMEQWGRVIQQLSTKTRDEIIEVIDLYNEAAQVGMDSGMSIMDTLVPDTVDPATYESLGRSITDGMASGIEDGSSAVTSAMQTLCTAVESTVKDYFQIHSPSRLMEKMFEYVGIGAENGLVDGGRRLVESAKAISADVASAMRVKLPRSSASAVTTGSGKTVVDQTINFNTPTATPYQVARQMKRYATYGLAGARS